MGARTLSPKLFLAFLVSYSLLVRGEASGGGRLPDCIIACEGQTDCLKKCLDGPSVRAASGPGDAEDGHADTSELFSEVARKIAGKMAATGPHTIGAMGPSGPRLCSDVAGHLEGKIVQVLLEAEAPLPPRGEGRLGGTSAMRTPASARARKHAVDGAFLSDGLEAMVLRAGSLDLLLSSGMIEHSTSGPRPSFSAMARWLRRGGILAVASGPIFGGEPSVASYKPHGLKVALKEAGLGKVQVLALDAATGSFVVVATKPGKGATGSNRSRNAKGTEDRGMADLLDGVVLSQNEVDVLSDAHGHAVAVAIECAATGGSFGNITCPKAWSSRATDLARYVRLPQYFLYDNDDLRKLVVAEWSAGVAPARGRRVLDIGCGSGVLLSFLKQQVPGITTECVELVPWAAEAARGRNVDMVYTGAINDVAHLMPENSYDAVIFSDSLEHMEDPWAVLRAVRPLLKADSEPGAVYACIPNIMHWDVMKDLLRGHFTYADKGILDRTHLRWFTRKSLMTMFESSGYTVTRLGFRGSSTPLIPRGLSKSVAKHIEGVDKDELEKDTAAFQFVLVARATHQIRR